MFLILGFIDNGITEYIANELNEPYTTDWTTNYAKGILVFPFTYYQTDDFWATVRYIIFI